MLKQAFSALAEYLDIAEDEAQEQFQQRASLNSDALETLLQSLQKQQLHWAWLVDAVWQQGANGQPATEDMATTAELAALWGIEHSWLGNLRQWSDLMRAREFEIAASHAESMFKKEKHANLVEWIKNSRKLLEFIFEYKSNTTFESEFQKSLEDFRTAITPKTLIVKADSINPGDKFYIKNILFNEGDTVKSGEKIMILSSVENGLTWGETVPPVIAPYSGILEKIYVIKGDRVIRHTELALLEYSNED